MRRLSTGIRNLVATVCEMNPLIATRNLLAIRTEATQRWQRTDTRILSTWLYRLHGYPGDAVGSTRERLRC